MDTNLARPTYESGSSGYNMIHCVKNPQVTAKQATGNYTKKSIWNYTQLAHPQEKAANKTLKQKWKSYPSQQVHETQHRNKRYMKKEDNMIL
jgi:hypothetical protein